MFHDLALRDQARSTAQKPPGQTDSAKLSETLTQQLHGLRARLNNEPALQPLRSASGTPIDRAHAGALIPINTVQTSPTQDNAFRRALAWRNGSTYSARLRLCA